MKLKEAKITVTVADTSGTSSATGPAVFGYLEAVDWIDGTYADGVDAVLACVNTNTGVDYTVLTLTDANSDARYHPRSPLHSQTGAALTFDSTQGQSGVIILNGNLKLTVTSAGSTAGVTGGCVVYYLE